MQPKITIAIDGYAACGKSTLAKALAKHFGYIYVDSGAMYRAVTLYFIQNNISLEDAPAIQTALKNIHIEFRNVSGENHTFLNGVDIEREIRELTVSNQVSYVSAISAVRRAMVKRQQEMGNAKGLAMDGRDIGTVVFKNAELKLFMTASIEARTQRRIEELHAKGNHEISIEDVQKNLLHRDHIDSTRQDSPLCQAADAIIIDNTGLTPEEQFQKAVALAESKIEQKRRSVVAVD